MTSEQDWRVTLRAGISPEIRERLNLHDEQDINLVLCRLGAEIETQEARATKARRERGDMERELIRARARITCLAQRNVTGRGPTDEEIHLLNEKEIADRAMYKDALTEAEARVKELEDGLRPLARFPVSESLEGSLAFIAKQIHDTNDVATITIGDVRRARALLAPKGGGNASR